MLAVVALLALAIQDEPAVASEPRRPEPPPVSEAQAAEDARYQVTEGERAGDAGTPGRYICQLTRVPGSNRRIRQCATADDRRRARELAREILPGAAGGTSVS